MRELGLRLVTNSILQDLDAFVIPGFMWQNQSSQLIFWGQFQIRVNGHPDPLIWYSKALQDYFSKLWFRLISFMSYINLLVKNLIMLMKDHLNICHFRFTSNGKIVVIKMVRKIQMIADWFHFHSLFYIYSNLKESIHF